MFGNPIRKFAVALIVVGALLLAGPSFGFSSLTADRTTSIETAAGEEALLGINETDQMITVSGNDDTPREIGILSNNLYQETMISVEVADIPGWNNDILQAGPSGQYVGTGNSIQATVQCAQKTSGNDQQEVVFRAESLGSSAEITDATFTVMVDMQCDKGNPDTSTSGLSGVSASNLSEGDSSQSQTFEFSLTEELQGNESVTITLRDVHQNKRLDYSGVTVESDTPGSVSSYEPNNQDYEIAFSPSETLSKGDRVTITVTGVDGSGSKAGKGSPYDVEFQRSDKGDLEGTSFTVN